MALGWKGEVLIDGFTVEKLTYPLSTPVVTEATLNADGTVTLYWEKVENATSYSIEVEGVFLTEPLGSFEVGNETSCTLSFDTSATTDDFIFHVTAHNGEEISYPGFLVQGLMPDYVGVATAHEATDVTASGFTANWEKADFANKYLVLPRQTHTAAADNTDYKTVSGIKASAGAKGLLIRTERLSDGSVRTSKVIRR